MSNNGDQPAQGSKQGAAQELVMSMSNNLLNAFLLYAQQSKLEDLEQVEVIRQVQEMDPPLELMTSLNVLLQFSHKCIAHRFLNLFGAIADGDIDLAQQIYFEHTQIMTLTLRLLSQVDEHAQSA